MTDNEIIKALECCNHNHVWQRECFDCEYATFEGQCGNELIKDALDLINRQKAKISELQSEATILTQANEHLQELCKEERAKVSATKQKLIEAFTKLKFAKSEAIRDFAEKLKNVALPITIGGKYEYEVVTKQAIDHFVKEMTEGENV